MIDTHAHLDFPQYDSDRDDVISAGFDSGLEAIINIGVDLETSQSSIELAEKNRRIYAAVGVHPHDSKNVPGDYISHLRNMALNKKVVAIGEIGLDYYRDHSPRDVQSRVFKEQLELAGELNLPVVIHVREALEDAFPIIEKSGIKKGVLHSFPGNVSDAKKAIKMGFYISFAGPLTYPKSSRVEAAASLPLSKIVVETDSPYLTPQAFRGKRNQPEYVRFVIEKLSEIFSPYTFEDIERITSRNACKLFNLPFEKSPKIVYKIRRSLYVNLTNRCTCNCYFCPRVGSTGGFVSGHYLYLHQEPTPDQVLEAIESEKDFDEVVFCGLGEPTLRLKELLLIAEQIKRRGHKTRLNTNGHGSLINKTEVPSKLAGIIDKVSVSLNATDPETYIEICKPDKGQKAYNAMVEFIKGCKMAGLKTMVSVVNLPDLDINACRKLASELDVEFRLRNYSDSG